MAMLDQQIIEIEGVELVCEFESSMKNCLQPGESYVARRNGAWALLTCRYVDAWNYRVVAKERAYPFNVNECFRVLRMIN